MEGTTQPYLLIVRVPKLIIMGVDMLHRKRPDEKSKQTDLAPELGPHLPSEHQSLDIQPHNKINQQPIHANPQPSQPTAKPR